MANFPEAKKLIVSGKITEAVDFLIEHKRNISTDDLLLLKANYLKNERDYSIGVITQEEHLVNSNKIIKSLLSYLSDDTIDNDYKIAIIKYNDKTRSNIGSPQVSENTSEVFTYKFSLPAGFDIAKKISFEKFELINSLSISIWSKFLVTCSNNGKIVYVWDVENGTVVSRLIENEPVSNVKFIFDDIYAVCGNHSIIIWRKVEDSKNKRGVSWTEKVRYNIPDEYLAEGYSITKFKVIANKSIYIVYEDESRPELVTLTFEYNEKNEGFSLVRKDSRLYAIKEVSQGSVAFVYEDYSDEKKRSKAKFIQYDDRIVEAEDIDSLEFGTVVIAKKNQGLFTLSQSLEPGFKSLTFGQRIIEWNHIAAKPHYRLVAATSGLGEIFIGDINPSQFTKKQFTTIIKAGSSPITGMKWSEYKYTARNPANRLYGEDGWKGRYLFSSSSENSIDAWKPESSNMNIGQFLNCHPVLHPFDTRGNLFAYSDKDGFIHLFTIGERIEKKETTDEYLRAAGCLLQFAYIISVIGYLFIWIPRIGFIKGVFWSFIAPFYFVFYELIWESIIGKFF